MSHRLERFKSNSHSSAKLRDSVSSAWANGELGKSPGKNQETLFFEEEHIGSAEDLLEMMGSIRA